MVKLDHFITSRTEGVKGLNNQYQLRACYDRAAVYYKKPKGGSGGKADPENSRAKAARSRTGTRKKQATDGQ